MVYGPGLRPVALRPRHLAYVDQRDRQVAQRSGGATQTLDQPTAQRQAFAVHGLGLHPVALRPRHLAHVVERNGQVAQRFGRVTQPLDQLSAQRQAFPVHGVGLRPIALRTGNLTHVVERDGEVAQRFRRAAEPLGQLAAQRQAFSVHGLGPRPVALRTCHIAHVVERDRQVAQRSGRTAQPIGQLAAQRQAFSVDRLGLRPVALRARHLAHVIERDGQVAQGGWCRIGSTLPRERERTQCHLFRVGRAPIRQQFLAGAPGGWQEHTVCVRAGQHAQPFVICEQRPDCSGRCSRRIRCARRLRGWNRRRRCSQFLAQGAHMPDVRCNASRFGPKISGHDQHQRPAQIAFQQKAAFVESRQEAAARRVPLLVARMALRREPASAGLRGQRSQTRHQRIHRRFGITSKLILGFLPLQWALLQQQALIEPICQLKRGAHIGEQKHQREAVGLPFEMAQQVDGDALGRSVKCQRCHANRRHRAATDARRTSRCRCGSSGPAGCRESAPAWAGRHLCPGRCHGSA